MVSRKRLGVTVMPESLQSEGIDAVLHNIGDRLAGTSVTTSPYVAAESGPGEGYREPPLDGGAGAKRLLDRPLWGKREVFMRTAPSFRPAAALYSNTTYAPETPTELTDAHGALIGDFIGKANERGMTTYLQVMAAIPPCLRVQFGAPLAKDQPLLPDGKPVPDRVDRNASLASPDVREYVRAMTRDLCRNYPDVGGFKFDWPEYPPYHFASLLADYNPQVEPYARSLGINLAALAKGLIDEVSAFRDLKHHWDLSRPVAFRDILADLRARSHVIDDHFRLRTHLVTDYASFLRDCVDDASRGAKKLLLQGFPPPWNLLSGFDAKAIAKTADEVAVKFYTMHWPMIGANYVDHGAKALGIDPQQIASFFNRHFMGNEFAAPASGRFAYPDPDVPHQISDARIKSAYAEIGVSDAIGIAHSYGPVADVAQRFQALLGATGHNIEINRYEYLSDEKLDVLSQIVNQPGQIAPSTGIDRRSR